MAVVNCVTVVEVRSDVDFVDLVEDMSRNELCYGVQRTKCGVNFVANIFNVLNHFSDTEADTVQAGSQLYEEV